MRTGLVALGIVLAVLGATALVAVVLPSDDPWQSHDATGAIVDLPAGETKTVFLPAEAAGHATLTFSWTADQVAVVELFATKPCSTGACAITPALETWPGGKSARWSASGSSAAEYEVSVEAWPTDPDPANFSGVLSESYRASDLALPLVPFALVLAAGATLTGIGGVILYLGLFLPAGVYGPLDAPPEGEYGPDEEGGGPGELEPSDPATEGIRQGPNG